MSTLSSVLPYYGGKRTIAPRIVGLMRSDRRMLVDACCGSLAVLMAAEPCAMEIANDLYGGVILLGRVLASDRYGDLANRVARTIAHEDLFTEAVERRADDIEPPERVEDVTDAHVEAAYWLLIESWIGRNGVAGSDRGNRTAARRYTPNGGSGGVRWSAVADSIHGWHERLARVWFQRVDVCELLERMLDAERSSKKPHEIAAVIYIDPPYRSKAGKRYRVKFTEQKHAQVSELARSFRHAQVLVSCQEGDGTPPLYPGWDVARFEDAPTQANAGRKGPSAGGGKPAELVLMRPGTGPKAMLFGGGA